MTELKNGTYPCRTCGGQFKVFGGEVITSDVRTARVGVCVECELLLATEELILNYLNTRDLQIGYLVSPILPKVLRHQESCEVVLVGEVDPLILVSLDGKASWCEETLQPHDFKIVGVAENSILEATRHRVENQKEINKSLRRKRDDG